jgi:hypothetical protein
VSVNPAIDQDISGDLIDFQICRDRADRDGHRSEEELRQLVAIAERTLPKVSKLIQTVGQARTMFACQDGMFGYRAMRSWTETHRSHASNVIAFRMFGEDAGCDAMMGD